MVTRSELKTSLSPCDTRAGRKMMKAQMDARSRTIAGGAWSGREARPRAGPAQERARRRHPRDGGRDQPQREEAVPEQGCVVAQAGEAHAGQAPAMQAHVDGEEDRQDSERTDHEDGGTDEQPARQVVAEPSLVPGAHTLTKIVRMSHLPKWAPRRVKDALRPLQAPGM